MSEMILSETAVVFECPACGHMEIVDSAMGEQPPDKCVACVDIDRVRSGK